LPDPAFILTRSGRYAAVFGGTDSRYYHDGSGLVGKSICDVLNPEKAAWFETQIAIALASHGLHVVEYPLAREDIKGLGGDGPAEVIWFEGRVQPLDYQVLDEEAVLWVASNITASKKLETLLRTQSETDSLTGLFNRRKLMSGLTEHFELFARYKTPTSVLIFDIDKFKGINDEYGHLAGDKVLKIIATVLRKRLRGSDFIARFGGEEFVLLLPATPPAVGAKLLETLRAAIEACPFHFKGERVTITVSMGLAAFRPGEHSDLVLKRADQALYRAKNAGRNRVELG